MPAAPDTAPPQEILAPLLAALDSIQPLMTVSRDDLVVIALESAVARPQAGYLTMADAQPGAFEFTELEVGAVPTVQAAVGVVPLVVLAGETIVGGKQNRIINVSVWLAPQKATAIPVTCLEAGRWDSGRTFRPGRQVDLRIRGQVNRMVSDAARSGPAPSFTARQGEVWQEISAREELAGRRSETQALHEIYASEEVDVERYVAAFPAPSGASGMAVAIGGRLVALDLFDSTEALQRQWPRLVAGAASAALDHRRRVAAGWLTKPQHRYPDPGALGRMLARARKATADATVNRSVGEGWDVRLATTRVHGSALVHDGRVVHLALFRDEG